MTKHDTYIVFTDDHGYWWSWFLKKSFRHCSVLKPSNGRYIYQSKTYQSYDLFNTIGKNDIIGDSFILVGYKPKTCKRGLFMLNTCVGHCKQVLGINNPFILTPYQLYKYMRRTNG